MLPNMWRVLPLIAIGIMWFGIERTKDQLAQERVRAHNLQASLDTSRTIFEDSVATVTERLAFQETREITLSRDLDRLIRADGTRVELLARLRIELDSVRGAVTRGDVSAVDSIVRRLEARLDTMGFHVSIAATVPRPSEPATVEWTVSHEPESVLVALNRTEEGQLALRALTGRNATARIDSAIARVEPNLRHTRSLATKGLIFLLGVAAALLLKL